MPPVSKAQNRFMQAAKNDPVLAKKLGIKPSAAKEFVAGMKPGAMKGKPERKAKAR